MSRTMIKLCGNHSFQDLKYSVASGVPYIGLVFAESKRKVDPLECSKWLEQIEKGRSQKYVGVFVNPSLLEIASVLQYVPLDIIQFHGDENPEQVIEAKMATGLTVWKAIHHNEKALVKMKSFYHIADGYVIDSKVNGAWGGTGKRFDWDAIPAYQKEAQIQGVPCFIAGGITPDNVSEILNYRPDGIDISSGIETMWRKDARKIQKLIEIIENFCDNNYNSMLKSNNNTFSL
ncbi:phosphoribosylanthranilate isomerase [Calidifontibacillus erzurumensis]|uniref:N-(5'-phosphoribosyl)anthranilate isomerase n=1 Tax=Calidifontibacillus erzurumensis TaxID=2741433 RepID=A0A8J8GIB5_9BACI|nr:phosphoribosylanthranilate isomerase [Calidifontibacillus erzurumensis]NSL52288.1 phosphoribosylanthranilate isomerase [Calidifontibacillus erzurumensis]